MLSTSRGAECGAIGACSRRVMKRSAPRATGTCSSGACRWPRSRTFEGVQGLLGNSLKRGEPWRKRLAIYLAMAGQEPPVFLAQSEHICPDAVTGDPFLLLVRHRRLRSHSAGWPDLLVGCVGDYHIAGGLDGCGGRVD